MFSWGANSHGQLGLNFSNEMCISPQQVTDLPFAPGDVKSIEGGGGHVMVLLESGRLFTSGWNSKGQLGLGHTNDQFKLTEVPNVSFEKIAAGWDISAGITEDGVLYVWGSNLWKQLGSNNEKLIANPSNLPMPANERISNISFGLRHTSVLTESNTIYLFGKSKWLENIKENKENMFLEMKLDSRIMTVVSGENHVLLLDENNIIKTFGDDRFGQTCPEVDKNPQNYQIVSMKSGWSNSGYLTEDGQVFLWGRNNYGQLGSGNDLASKIPLLLNIPSRIKEFHLGSQHGMVVADDGVYTWGWNEHGNCGNGQVDDVFSPQKINIGAQNIHLSGCGAGFCYVCVIE